MAAVPAAAAPLPPEQLADLSSSSSRMNQLPLADGPAPPVVVYSTHSTPAAPAWPTTLTYFLALLGVLALLARALEIAARNRRRRKDAVRRRRKEKLQRRRARQQQQQQAKSGNNDNDDDDDDVPRDVRDLRLAEAVGVDEFSSAASESEDDDETNDIGDYAAVLGSALTSLLVNLAILLKRSPLPDLLFSLTNATLDGYARINRTLGIETKIVRATQKAVAAGVTATGVLAHAAIRAGLAYQMAPGRREKKMLRMSTATATPRGGAENGRGGGGGGGNGLAGYYSAGLSLPGGIPRGAKTSVATQTGWDGDTTSLAASASSAPVPATATSVRGVLATYLSSTLRVAGNAATAGSEAVFGKTRTQKLMGVDPASISGGGDAANGVYDDVYDECDDEDHGAGPVVYVNVGGAVHATTLRTLTAVPGSLLAEWFGDASKRSTLELKDGTFFIDRDGTNFHHILAYLRNPTNTSNNSTTTADSTTSTTQQPLTPAEISQLIVEAIFYRLPALVDDDLTLRLARAERNAHGSVSELAWRVAARAWSDCWTWRCNALVVVTAVTVGVGLVAVWLLTGG
ncbi:hypothetical protein HDU86_007596 [Geranomyces michiganensis]|nr:hypothetical protein HDU86_007596 [Geranomyces michiganensis]